ncbi:MAG: hypothetical protein R3F33_16135 [Planctomycetota bacterium]
MTRSIGCGATQKLPGRLPSRVLTKHGNPSQSRPVDRRDEAAPYPADFRDPDQQVQRGILLVQAMRNQNLDRAGVAGEHLQMTGLRWLVAIQVEGKLDDRLLGAVVQEQGSLKGQSFESKAPQPVGCALQGSLDLNAMLVCDGKLQFETHLRTPGRIHQLARDHPRRRVLRFWDKLRGNGRHGVGGMNRRAFWMIRLFGSTQLGVKRRRRIGLPCLHGSQRLRPVLATEGQVHNACKQQEETEAEK